MLNNTNKSQVKPDTISRWFNWHIINMEVLLVFHIHMHKCIYKAKSIHHRAHMYLDLWVSAKFMYIHTFCYPTFKSVSTASPFAQSPLMKRRAVVSSVIRPLSSSGPRVCYDFTIHAHTYCKHKYTQHGNLMKEKLFFYIFELKIFCETFFWHLPYCR